MTSSMNIHRIQSITAQMESANGHKWTNFMFMDAQGSIFTLAVHSEEWLPIVGAEHINHVTNGETNA